MTNSHNTWRKLGLCLAAAIVSTGAVQAADLVAKNFDTDIQEFSNGWGAARSYSWDSSLDASNNPASGSLLANVDFTTERTTTLQGNLSVPSYAGYEKVRLSVYMDPTNSPSTAGNYGTISVRLRGPNSDWGPWPGTEIPLGTITNTGWTHFEKALPVDTIARSYGVNVHWNTAYTDQRAIHLDNLVFVERAATPPPPSLTLTKAGPGLEIRSVGGPDYARRNVATSDTLAPVLSWVGASAPVTYSMAINENVQPFDSPGYSVNIMLCADSGSTINASPDWNMASGIFMAAQLNTNRTFDVSVRFKTNSAGSHGIRFTDAGLLINKTNTSVSSLVGTWSLTLNGTAVTLAGPGGISGTGNLPPEALDSFSPALGNYMWALFGVQPNQQNERVISLSRVTVQGAVDFSGNVNQIFTAVDTLDANLQLVQEGTGGIVLKPTNTTWRVQWGLPDTGMYLWSASSLASNAWKYTELTAISQGANRTVFTTNVSSSAGYFQLRNSGPALPPILLESFETGAYANAANPPYTNVTLSTTTGVTEGNYSMEVRFDASQAWSWFSKDYDAAAYTSWKSRSKLMFDLHRAPESFGWNLELAIALNGGMGWNQAQVVNWEWLNGGESKTQTITWDYSTIKAGAPASGTLQLNFMGRGGAGGNFYIDNVRFSD